MIEIDGNDSLSIEHKKKYINQLTPGLIEPEGSMPHSQGLSNNAYPEPNQPNFQH